MVTPLNTSPIFIRDIDTGDILDKNRNYGNYMRYFLNRTQHMFKYEGLPETIPQRELELLLQQYGHCAIADWNGSLYATKGNWGGKPNVYLRPENYIVANPVLGSRTFKWNEDCIVMGNDTLFVGLWPMFARYCQMFTEADISMYMALINSRIISIISAKDDKTKLAADKFIQDIIAGKLTVVAEDEFLEGLKATAYSSPSSEKITDLIEFNQYQLARFYNDLGLNANYNMKREAINSSEAQMNNDALYPLIDDMLEMRKRKIEDVNNMFGTSITVELDGIWKKKDEQEIEEVREDPTEDATEQEEKEVPEDVKDTE